jgi:deazaflavin-dependent oxidoreductase (nitroreductase family)
MSHWGTRLHAALYRLTRGRLLGRMGGRPVLVLETTGRRTQRRRATPLQYLADGEDFVVVASDRGAVRPPAWYLNLRASPDARLRVGPRTIDVHGRETSGDERAELWRRLSTADHSLERAAAKAGRELPLVALTPVDPRAGR